MLDQNLKNKILFVQENEITEHNVYKQLAQIVKIKSQTDVLEKISREELAHYEFLKNITQEEVRPNAFKVFYYVFISKILGLNFGLRLMENGEHLAQEVYAKLKGTSPNIDILMQDEHKHERELLDLIDEDHLKYISSVILGLNDALIELTATLAGFTLALQNTKLIGMLGLITGIAAAMSMGVSEFLATRGGETDKNPLKASLYTGLSYIATIVVLVFPYFLLSNIFVCLSWAVGMSLVVILVFTFYISVAKNLDFKKRFLEMAGLSLSIAAITFFIGMFIRKVFGITV